MRYVLVPVFASGLLILVSITLYADIPPKPSPRKERIVSHTTLTIVPDSKAYDARLQISRASLRQLRTALEEVPMNESMVQRITHNSKPTIVAGSFLFLCLSFAGILLARSPHARAQNAVAAILFGLAIVGATTIVTQANAGPPAGIRWRNLPKNLSEGRPTQGSVDVEIVPDGDGMTLIVPLSGSSEQTPE